MDRRSFLRRSTLALAGGLLVGDAALEAFDRLTHRKVFALGGLPERSYLSDLFRPGDGVALVRSGAIVEFGVIAVAPTMTVSFNSPITMQPNDLMIRAQDSGHPDYFLSFPGHGIAQMKLTPRGLAWGRA